MTRLMLTKDPRIAPRANASLGATRAAYGAFPDHEVAPGLSTQNSRRHGLAARPYARSRPALDRTPGATCAHTGRGTPGGAPVWHAQVDRAACRLVSTEAPDARASRRYEACASSATAGGFDSAHSPVGFYAGRPHIEDHDVLRVVSTAPVEVAGAHRPGPVRDEIPDLVGIIRSSIVNRCRDLLIWVVARQPPLMHLAAPFTIVFTAGSRSA